MRFRQIHLDFHTSEKIPGVGSRFDKSQFQDALRRGHVDSVTVFSKCHHGWAYHPSVANEMHPTLKFDLLGAEIEAAHEIGVKTPVYISAGFDEKMARRHPEWLRRKKDDQIDWTIPGYHEFCMNSPYLDYLVAQVEEVVQNYYCDGIFLDIVGVRVCYCQNCVRTLLDEGKDPYDEKNARELGERVFAEYCRRIREAVDKYKPGLPVFHNSGHVRRGRRDLVSYQSHLELESLPTGGWGYDHFPLSASYSRTLGKDYLGMTGKFHNTWGEFGGFKHPNALRYEEALCVAFGAKCSVGDQLHPDGLFDTATYDLIGAAYSEVEKKEPWLDGVTSVADIAVLSQEAVMNYYGDSSVTGSKGAPSDVGAVRVLLEGKYLFDVVDCGEDLSKYKLVILPDTVTLDAALTQKLKSFCSRGGKVLAAGESGVDADGNFALDFGSKFVGPCAHRPVYLSPDFDISPLTHSAFVIYDQCYEIEAQGNAPLCRLDPYFDRSTFAFCSHQHTPYDRTRSYPAASFGADGAYIGAKLFSEYAKKGSLISKLILHHFIDALLGDSKTLVTDLPAQGVATLMDQTAENRLVCHLLYAFPVRRGEGVEVIEDVVPLYGVHASLDLGGRSPKRVYLAPEKRDIDYSFSNGRVSFTLDKLDLHAMIVVDY